MNTKLFVSLLYHLPILYNYCKVLYNLKEKSAFNVIHSKEFI